MIKNYSKDPERKYLAPRKTEPEQAGKTNQESHGLSDGLDSFFIYEDEKDEDDLYEPRYQIVEDDYDHYDIY
jgi:hypothetical protein